MAKVSRILALLALVAMLAALPLSAFAQQEPPHVVMGSAMVNGAVPATGAEIVAMDGANKVGSAMVMDGRQVQHPGNAAPQRRPHHLHGVRC